MLTLAIDEAGKGPLIGSLFIAGAVFEESDLPKLKKLGVKDSKLILHKKRIELAKEIKKISKFKTIQIPPSEIDEAIDGDNSLNLNWLEAHKIAEIINALKPDRAIIDCPSPNIPAYTNYVKELLKNKKTELIVEHKADLKFISVAAGSIISKCEREKEISKLKEKYGNIGSGYPADPKTKEFLEKNYKKYPEIFRKSWAPFKKLIKNKKQSKLSDF